MYVNNASASIHLHYFLYRCVSATMLHGTRQSRNPAGHPVTYIWVVPATISSLLCNKPWAVRDDVIKWKHFPRYWPFVRGIHRSPVNSRHKDQWRGALMFSFMLAWINGWANNGDAGDLRIHRAHHDVTVMVSMPWFTVMMTIFHVINSGSFPCDKIAS